MTLALSQPSCDASQLIDTFRARAGAAFAEIFADLAPEERAELAATTRRAADLLGSELPGDGR